MAKRTTRKRSRKTAPAKAPGRTLATADASDVRSGRSLADRLAIVNRQSLVRRAVERCRPGNKRGSKSTVWAVPEYVLLELATMVIVDHRSQRDAIEEITSRKTPATLALAGVPSRNVSLWMKSIYEEYQTLADEELRERASVAELEAASGDPTMTAVVFSGMVVRMVGEHVGSSSWGSLSVGEQHAVLRTLELQIGACKVFAEAKHKDAQAAQIIRRLIEAEGGNDKRPQFSSEDLKTLLEAIETGDITKTQDLFTKIKLGGGGA